MLRLSRSLAIPALLAALLVAPSDAPAQSDAARTAARSHAAAITAAFDRMAGFIRSAPAAGVTVPARLPYEWSSSADVPAAGGWLAEWTRRGLDLRYCEHVLVVFAASADLLGTDQRTVQSHGGFQWLIGGVARGLNRVTLPACMGTLPDRRVALAGRVVDPFGWDVVQRRLVVDRWKADCPPPGKPTETLGYRQMAQRRPVEVHPFDGSDMNRWPATCTDRRGPIFTWNGRTMPLPDRARCTPEGETGTDLAGAEVYETCAPPYDPQGNNEPRWHLNDQLCTEAEAAGVSTALDGHVWHGPPRKSYAGPASGHPSPILPPVPACMREAHCPAEYTRGGAIGTALRIRKYRYAWSGATIRAEDNRNPSWQGPTAQRIYDDCRNPGATGDGFLYDGSEDLAACYYDHTEPARCPSECSASGSRQWRVFYECRKTVVSDTRYCDPPDPPPSDPNDPDYDPDWTEPDCTLISNPPVCPPDPVTDACTGAPGNPTVCTTVTSEATCLPGETPSGALVERVCTPGGTTTLSDTRTCSPAPPPPGCRDEQHLPACGPGEIPGGEAWLRVCDDGETEWLSDTRTCTPDPSNPQCPPGTTGTPPNCVTGPPDPEGDCPTGYSTDVLAFFEDREPYISRGMVAYCRRGGQYVDMPHLSCDGLSSANYAAFRRERSRHGTYVCWAVYSGDLDN